MQTRAQAIAIPDDDDDEITVVQAPDRTIIGLAFPAVPVPVGREATRDLDTTLRHPAECRFFITAGWRAGADVDVIADSLARGDEWMVTQDWAVRSMDNIVCLSDPEVPRERQMFAWRARRRPAKDGGQ